MTLVSAWCFDLFADDNAWRSWPGPPQGRARVQLRVSADGVVLLGELRAVVLALGGHLSKAWLLAVGMAAPSIGLLEFLQAACTAGGGQGALFAQLVWAIAERLEDCMSRCLSGALVFDHAKLFVVDWASTGMYQLDRLIANYMQSVKDWTRNGIQYLSLATDKSRVHGLGLANTLFVGADNVSWWGAPQVEQKLGCLLRARARCFEVLGWGADPCSQGQNRVWRGGYQYPISRQFRVLRKERVPHGPWAREKCETFVNLPRGSSSGRL